MSVHDYLLDHDGFDWPGLLSGWSWLLPPEFAVWLVNRFGDLFLVPPDGSVLMLDVGAGTLTKLAELRDDFVGKIDEGDNADDWLMIPLVDRLTAAGIVTGPGECYSYRIPPVMGGEYTIENTAVLKIAEHYGAYGSIHEQIRGVPDGEQVVLKVRELTAAAKECNRRARPFLERVTSLMTIDSDGGRPRLSLACLLRATIGQIARRREAT